MKLGSVREDPLAGIQEVGIMDLAIIILATSDSTMMASHAGYLKNREGGAGVVVVWVERVGTALCVETA